MKHTEVLRTQVKDYELITGETRRKLELVDTSTLVQAYAAVRMYEHIFKK